MFCPFMTARAARPLHHHPLQASGEEIGNTAAGESFLIFIKPPIVVSGSKLTKLTV